MITLEEIKEFAIEHNACSAEFYPFIDYINKGDEKSAWKTVCGNLGWLNTKGLNLVYSDILQLADQTSIVHFSKGTISRICKYDSLCITNITYFYLGGNVSEYIEYKGKIKHGKHQYYLKDGKKHLESCYVNGKEIYREFFDEFGNLEKRFDFIDCETYTN